MRGPSTSASLPSARREPMSRRSRTSVSPTSTRPSVSSLDVPCSSPDAASPSEDGRHGQWGRGSGGRDDTLPAGLGGELKRLRSSRCPPSPGMDLHRPAGYTLAGTTDPCGSGRCAGRRIGPEPRHYCRGYTGLYSIASSRPGDTLVLELRALLPARDRRFDNRPQTSQTQLA